MALTRVMATTGGSIPASDTGGGKIRKRSRTLLVIVIGVVLVAATATGILLYVSSSGGQTTGTSANPCSVVNNTSPAPGNVNATTSDPSATVTITIIESDPGNNYEGINGSAYHIEVPWPVITVHQGQKVVFHVYNCASSESHGFAVSHYFNAGVTVEPGQSQTVTFVANQKGSFRVFCSIFCAIHPLMQNGELIVV